MPAPPPFPSPVAADETAPSGRSRGRTLGFVLGGLLVIAGAAAGGAAIALSVDHNSKPPSSSPGAGTTSSPGTPSSSNVSMNVSAVAACVEPAVVDLSTPQGAGTGMILTPGGIVLTNNHVVSGATAITAQVDGAGRSYHADVLGVDPSADVALIKLEGASGLSTVHLGNSHSLAIGTQVVAIGNALDLRGPPTVTQGIVSALDRSISASDPGGPTENLSGLIQTDAPINPGNSGGPLVDASCHVVGMNTAAASGNSTQSATNIGFAIPINTAAAIVRDIEAGRASRTVLLGERGYIGVYVVSVAEAESPSGLSGPTGNYTSPVSTGAVIVEALPGLPAANAGLQSGDVIVSFAGRQVVTPNDLSRLISLAHPYQVIRLGWVDLNGVHHTSTVTLAIVAVK